MAKTKPVTAAGGVVYKNETNHPKVLLIFRRGVWDLPKGKLEDGETIRECAVREVAEEVGIEKHPEITHTLDDTYHEYDQGGVHYGKTTHWFAMRLTTDPVSGFKPQKQEGIEEVEWVSLQEAKTRVGYENLFDVLTSFERLHQKNS